MELERAHSCYESHSRTLHRRQHEQEKVAFTVPILSHLASRLHNAGIAGSPFPGGGEDSATPRALAAASAASRTTVWRRLRDLRQPQAAAGNKKMGAPARLSPAAPDSLKRIAERSSTLSNLQSWQSGCRREDILSCPPAPSAGHCVPWTW